MPVSSNVSHQNVKSVHSLITLKSCLRKHVSASLSKSTANTNCKLRSKALNTCQTRQTIELSAEQGTARLLREKYTALVQRISEWPEPYPSEKRGWSTWSSIAVVSVFALRQHTDWRVGQRRPQVSDLRTKPRLYSIASQGFVRTPYTDG